MAGKKSPTSAQRQVQFLFEVSRGHYSVFCLNLTLSVEPVPLYSSEAPRTVMKRRLSSLTLKDAKHPSQWLGFDLDMTLIRYKIDNLQHHIFDTAKQHLIEEMAYPKEALDVRVEFLAYFMSSVTLANILLFNDSSRTQPRHFYAEFSSTKPWVI